MNQAKEQNFFAKAARFLSPWPCILLILLLHLMILFAARSGMLYLLWPDLADSGQILHALGIGIRFDARIGMFMALPVIAALIIPPLEKRISGSAKIGRRIICGLQTLIFLAITLVYIVDFAIFLYLGQRVDLTFLSLLEDPAIGLTMVWQSYPVIPILLLLALFCLGYYLVLGKILAGHQAVPVRKKLIPARILSSLAGLLLLVLIGFGQFSINYVPLRWSNAYFSPDPNLAVLALNPVQNLWDSRHFINENPPDEEAAAEAFPRVAAWLGLPPDQPLLNYTRTVTSGTGEQSSKPNIVILIVESLSWPHTSLAQLPPEVSALDPTPFLADLAKNSLVFDNYYAPARTTARAIFSFVTGLADYNFSSKSTSRNFTLLDQNTVLNQFEGYEKYFMLGGSAGWANIRGIFQYNVRDMHIIEDTQWNLSGVDVWGVSDLDLLREGVKRLDQSSDPFIAVIQTAGFHDPYTIPEHNDGFVYPPDPGQDLLKRAGFEDYQVYAASRFMDHGLRRFFELAEQSDWFSNTIFAVLGDHGFASKVQDMPAGYNASQLYSWHTPLLLYAPGRIEPGLNHEAHSHLDTLPTLASLAGLEYQINTLGRDMLNPDNKNNLALICRQDFNCTLVSGDYCFNLGPQESLYDLTAPTLENLLTSEPELAERMRVQALDLFQTTKYLLFNNSKKLLEGP